MRESLRRAFAHLLIPAAIGVIWYHAHVRSVSSAIWHGSWREGGAIVTGNPYRNPFHVPLSRATWPGPNDVYVEDDEEEVEDAPTQAVADLNAPDDARP